MVIFGVALVATVIWIMYIAGYLVFVKILPAIFNI